MARMTVAGLGLCLAHGSAKEVRVVISGEEFLDDGMIEHVGG
ncbi:MAG: hypothetical protein ACYDEH_04120 [Acidimicrobiales bacterium]